MGHLSESPSCPGSLQEIADASGRHDLLNGAPREYERSSALQSVEVKSHPNESASTDVLPWLAAFEIAFSLQE